MTAGCNALQALTGRGRSQPVVELLQDMVVGGFVAGGKCQLLLGRAAAGSSCNPCRHPVWAHICASPPLVVRLPPSDASTTAAYPFWAVSDALMLSPACNAQARWCMYHNARFMQLLLDGWRHFKALCGRRNMQTPSWKG